MMGSGLGGTWLVNANVAIRPSRDVFAGGAWPKAIAGDPEQLDPYFATAEHVLGVSRHPQARQLAKVRTLERYAERHPDEVRFEELKLAVNFEARGLHPVPGFPKAVVDSSPCTDCGDCITGCNVGAKNTVYKNYLPAAARYGCRIYAQCEVLCLEHRDDAYGGYWRIHYTHHTEERPGTVVHTLLARVVILGARALGSTEILLRSEAEGVSLSPQGRPGLSAKR